MGYEDWIGRTSRREETVTERQLSHFRATFGDLVTDHPVPPGFHWCLVPDLSPAEELGRDGHPRPGIFVPVLPLPRRMWAGGTLEFLAPLIHGAHVTRDSTVKDIAFKTGGSGALAFLTIEHLWVADGTLAIREQQDIVYREDPKPGEKPKPPIIEPWDVERAVDFNPDPVLLFRYSALTFNGHRIHYDHPYATGVEGYEGLVVHGPMQALVMLNLATRVLGRLPVRFRYRGLSPFICGRHAIVEARRGEAGLDLRVRTDDDVATMSATAT